MRAQSYPEFPTRFVTYLWASLVTPVMGYGMELFPLSEACVKEFDTRERSWWRRLLQVGGRAPNACVQVLFGACHASLEWRVRRVCLLLRLANARASSSLQLALIAHWHLQTPWVLAAFYDLALVFPGVRMIPTMVSGMPYFSSSGSWSEDGDWMSLHAYQLPVNVAGHRYRPCTSVPNDTRLTKGVAAHIKRAAELLRTSLRRDSWTRTYDTIVAASFASDCSKSDLMALRLHTPGPPLQFSLENIALPSHRAAFASLLTGDWFLAKYARNHFI